MADTFVAAAPRILWEGVDDSRFAAATHAVTVVHDPEGLDHAEIELVDWGPSASGPPGFLFQDLRLGAELSIELGGERRAIVFRGRVTAFEDRHGFDGPPELVVLAENAAQRLARRRSSRVFASRSVDDVLRQLASEVSLEADVSVSSVTDTWHQLNESSLAFARRLVRPYGIPIRVVDDRTLRVRPHEPAAQRIQLDTRSEPMRVRIGVDLAHQYRRLVVAGHNLGSGERVRADADAMRPAPRGRTAAAELADLGFDGDAHQPLPFATSQALAEAWAQGGFGRRAGAFVHGDIACVGRPELTVDAEIELAGVSDRLRGTYVVDRCVHRFDRQHGYGCHLAVSRGEWQR